MSLIFSENGRKFESSGSISRDGILVCKSDIKSFFFEVVQQAINKASNDKELFKNRSRRDNPGLKVRPLRLDFEQPIFKEKSNNHKLISAPTKMPNRSLSVFHVNPYLNASMVDYADGSTYRIWVLSENDLIIVPGSGTFTATCVKRQLKTTLTGDYIMVNT